MDSHLIPILSLLGGGLAAFWFARIARLDVIVAFFSIGALLGPSLLGVVPTSETIHFLGEVGLSFFLYEVGSHLSLKTIRKEWKLLFLVGPLYCGIVALGVVAIGPLLGLSIVASILGAGTVALSSTAVALKLVQADRLEGTSVGKTILAVLLFQDIFAVMLLALVPAFSGGSLGSFLWILTKMLISVLAAFVLVISIGRLLLQPFFRWVFQQDAEEVFTGAALFIVLSIAGLVHPLGLSLPLGTFLAGVALAETNYTYLVQSELRPFRNLLLSLFFVSVGLTLDVRFLFEHIFSLILLTLVLTSMKFYFGAQVFQRSGLTKSQAYRAGALLAQGSEFGFALVAALLGTNLITAGEAALFSGSIGLSLALSPTVARVGCRLSRRFAEAEVQEEGEPVSSDAKEVILVEYSKLTQRIADLLSLAGVPYRIHDRDWDRIATAKSLGYHAFFSNPSQPRTISRAAMGHALAVIVLTDDHTIAKLIAKGIQSLEQSVPLLFSTSDLQLFEELSESEQVFLRQEDEEDLEFFRTILRTVGLNQGDAATVVAQLLSRETPSFSELSFAETRAFHVSLE